MFLKLHWKIILRPTTQNHRLVEQKIGNYTVDVYYGMKSQKRPFYI